MNHGIRVTGRSGSSIERVAHIVRKFLAPNATPLDHLDGLDLFENVLEAKGARLTGGRDVLVAVEPLSRKVEAHTQFDGSANAFFLTISDQTYDSLERGETRARFTLGHEIGHLVLHSSDLRLLGQLPHRELMLTRSRDTHRAFEDSEWQANRFSSALLMPARGLELLRLRERLDEDDVARTFNTSYEAAAIRIREFLSKREELLRVTGTK